MLSQQKMIFIEAYIGTDILYKEELLFYNKATKTNIHILILRRAHILLHRGALSEQENWRQAVYIAMRFLVELLEDIPNNNFLELWDLPAAYLFEKILYAYTQRKLKRYV